TPAQNAANQRNAQLSTGPTSEAGKAKSSLNAVKTGLTGRTVLLPGDDAALYEAHIAEFMKRLQPLTNEERTLARQHDFDDPAALGFEFSLAQIEVRATDIDPDLFTQYEDQDEPEAA
ncbi:MAG: hypothetical protein WB992_08380, partial [Bryobacteraceae bacterium]